MAMSKLQAVAVWLLDIGYMLQVVGISPLCWNWYNARVCIALGLWDIDLYPNSVWLTATKTLEATGVGFGLFALLIVFSLVCLPRFYHWTVMLVAIFSSVIAGVSILTGIGIYANKLRHVFDFSSAPNCTAGLLFILAGGLLAVDVCRIRQHNSRAHTQGHQRESENPYNCPFVLSDYGHPSNHGGHNNSYESAGYGHVPYGDQRSGDGRAVGNIGFGFWVSVFAS